LDLKEQEKQIQEFYQKIFEESRKHGNKVKKPTTN